jgi:hypothetical protein
MHDDRAPAPAGYSIDLWCHAVGISRRKFYLLQEHERPNLARIGRRLIIVESPAEYLHRLADLQRQVAA